jgi:hypothetical protein
MDAPFLFGCGGSLMAGPQSVICGAMHLLASSAKGINVNAKWMGAK